MSTTNENIIERALNGKVSTQFMKESVDRIHNIDQTKWTPDEIAEWYDKWSNEYESSIHLLEQRGSSTAADYIDENFCNTKDVKILDVACGTGALAQMLAKRGYTNIDGLDPSQGMLDQAEQTGVYTKLICSFVETTSDKDIQEGTYDIVVCVGSIAPNHLPASAVDPMCKFLKPGGVMIIIGCHQCWASLDQYHIQTRAEFDRLISKGEIETVLDVVMDEYLKTEKWIKGAYFVFRKL